MSCPSLESLAAWSLGELGEEEASTVEEHLFACDRCAGRTSQMQALVFRVRSLVPPLLTAERRRKLESAVNPLPKVVVLAGSSANIYFDKNTEVGFWLMKADLDGVVRVDCELLLADGAPYQSFPDVPFDAGRGEVVLACQIHYRTIGSPGDIVARLTSRDRAGGERVAEYRLHHFFEE